MTDHEGKAREIIQAGYCGTCKRLCGGHVICGTDEYPCDYPVWEPLRDNDELFVSAIASALREAEAGERERCAKIAETAKTLKAWLPTNDDGTGETEHTTIHGEAIAAAIRIRNDE